MGRITVVHTADLHLGSSFKGVPPHVGRQRRKDLIQTLAKISETCRQQQTDLLLVAGDLWDEQYVTRPLVDFVADQFRRIPATRVIIAPGQADCDHENSFYREYPWSDNVHIFHQPQLSSIWIPHLNTRIYGRAWAEGEPQTSLNWDQVAEDTAGSQVLVVAYGTPDTLKFPQNILEMENLAYVALGGAHKHVPWAGKVLDPGCPEPLGFSHHGVHGILQGNIGTAASSVELVPTASRQYYKLQVNIEDCTSLEDIAAKVKRVVASNSPGMNLFHVDLAGKGKWDLKALQEMLDVFYISFQDSTETTYDVDALEAEHTKGVVGKYITSVKEAQDKDEKVCMRALALGLDALLSGRVAPW